ncbi:MORN motif protein (macronuclear) [Tetrahymena thermophila SB210]|uniref:MORN motif protein n=1 Tax=Tetrahymena thermophila (strain SB210) TaxID=312017 RepID=Q22LT7_TETTS|nr:MORN motif protein [Tetrahymena thermophila SB210]EAR86179.2 MORN motif protein [Tetrahymena thermophila SB210]|eukprot:XP_976774.2 MORN motif protein [Tetrahymena thermophila SB210]
MNQLACNTQNVNGQQYMGNNNQFVFENQIKQALSNFDQQFEQNQKRLNEFIQEQKEIMRQQFEQFLRDEPQNVLQFIRGQIEPIQKLFDCINDSIKQQYSQNETQVNIDFTSYLDKFGIPDFMREQLKKFNFNLDEFENAESQDLIEEDREKSLIIGQKDNKNQYSGRALIIYKSDPAAIYLGYMKDNKRHGRGILVLNGFQYYLGEFYNNKEWGYGEIQLINKENKNEKYVGYFSEGKRCGSGQQVNLDTNTKEESTYVSVNYFNESLHGPRVQSFGQSQQYKFQLFQYEKNYFSFKDQWSDKAPLQNIFVSTKGKTEGQALNLSPELSIDHSFKEDQQINQEQPNPYEIPSINQNNFPQNQQFGQQNFQNNPYFMAPPQNYMQNPQNFMPPQQGIPFPPQYPYQNPQQQFPLNPNAQFQQQQVYKSVIKQVIFDNINKQ